MSGVTLLTGGTGFVGRQVLRALDENGAQVRAVVRNGKQNQIASLNCIEAVITTQDLFAEDSAWWSNVCADVDTIIHVAWYAEPGQYLHSSKNLDCLLGTLQMAKGAAQAGVRRFIGIGTCFEYDLTGGLLSTSTALRPLTPYAGAKAAVFTALSQWLPSQNVEFAWCRLFYLYGEGEDSRRLVPYLHAQLNAGKTAELTSGNQIRDFLNVRDAGRLIVRIAMGDEHGPINVCSTIPVSVRQIAEQIADEYGRRDLLRFGVRPENLNDPICVVGSKHPFESERAETFVHC